MSPNPAPLTPDQVDELLSAELDGEFDAAAADLGLTVAEARALLSEAPGATTRRAALASARDALAAVPAVDEVTGARLRAAAADAFRDESATRSTPRRSHRWLVYASGGIAAALIGVFALAAVNQSSRTKSAESASRVAANTPPPSHVQPRAGSGSGATPAGLSVQSSVGSFSNSRDLARAAFDSYTKTTEKDAAATAATSPVPRSEFSSSTISLSTDQAAGAFTATPPQCSTRPSSVAPDDRLVGATNATLAGKPVVARVYSHGTQFVVVVLRPDCSVVAIEHVS